MLGTASGLALTCGINAYLPLFVLGVLSRTGTISLQPGFSWLLAPAVLAGLLVLALVDLVADKIPVLDHAWDIPHTVARPIAAILCVAAVLDTNSDITRTLVALLGGALGGSVHTGKAAARLASSSGGGGLLSLPISIAEDLAVIVLLVLSFAAPAVTLALGVIALALFLWFAPTLWHVLRLQWHVMRGVLRSLTGSGATLSPESIRQHSLFQLPDWALSAVNGITGPDDPPRSALQVTVRGLKVPRHAWLVITEKRIVLAGRTLTHVVKLHELPLLYIRVAQLRRGWLFPSLNLLDLDGKRLRIDMIDAPELLVQDVAAATLASLPPDARNSISDPPSGVRRIG